MTAQNKVNVIASLFVVAAVSLGCGSLMPGSNQTAGVNNSTGTAPPANSGSNSTSSTNSTTAKVEPADFT
jgi:hypothetical protein